MAEENSCTRWLWLALTLPAATLVAFAIASRLEVDDMFFGFVRSFLPPSLVGLAHGAPAIGWTLFTLFCSGWLCYERTRYRGVSGTRQWVFVLCVTPFLSVLHAVTSMIVAWPGFILVSTF